MYTERMQHVAVLGAAGKMGSGITLLSALELADLSLLPENQGVSFKLTAFDLFPEGPEGLKQYLHKQAARKAGRMAEKLRQVIPAWLSLDDEAVGKAYADHALTMMVTTDSLADVAGAGLVFEAVSENPNLKIKLFKDIEFSGKGDTWYFTNTSSVPIHILDEGASLGGRILGFHFYNPPAVQRLVELIVTSNTLPEMRSFAEALAARMGKIIVPANDFAGFIGNGHFMRDALYGMGEALKLSESMPFAQAISIINHVSKEFLIRPMGIFQLMDYVGLDVVRYILGVMNPYFPQEDLHSALLDDLVEKGVRGGQHPDGSQKDGYFRYTDGEPSHVLDVASGDYMELVPLRAQIEAYTGPLPASHLPWKQLIKDAEKNSKLQTYFDDLKAMETKGASLARSYMERSRQIGKLLVRDGIALSDKDVNTVLLTGFFHAYGPLNDYMTP